MKILLVDNYDSFTYNLVHMVEEITGEYPDIIKNDQIDLDTEITWDKIILSPGPGIPSEAGKLMEFIQKFKTHVPILGVCLGQQAIAEVFGGTLKQLENVHHGVASHLIEMQDEILFSGLNSPIQVGRYHSWVVNENDFPASLQITSKDENRIIMSLKHKHLPLRAVQFHPESILTPDGKKMMYNWIFS